MIEISKGAQEYFSKLIAQQDMDNVGLHLSVLNPGTPSAACDLKFHLPEESNELDQEIEYELFKLYVPRSSEPWLTDATIDFEKSDEGGQLTIKAPGIKGKTPDDSVELSEKVAWLLDAEINPGLAAHGGRVALEMITEKKEVVLRFGGGCHGCGMVDVTLKIGIEKTLKEHFPEITAIIDATDHDSGDNPYYK